MSSARHILSLFRSGDASPFKSCQWPFGDPSTKEFHFCGEKSAEGFSYCAKHAAMAYREPEPRRNPAPFPVGRRAA
jgi:hypothetical protein